MALTFPDGWLTDIENALANPNQFRWVGWEDADNWEVSRLRQRRATTVPAFLREQYELFHSRAVSHSITKGEHEAASLMNFYIVLKYKLWRAEYDTRLEYIQDVTNQPFVVSASTIEHFCANVEKLLPENIPIREIVAAWGKAKGAAGRVAQLADDVVPEGGKRALLGTIAELAPAEAHGYLNDLEHKDVIKANSALYDEATQTLKLEITILHPMPKGAKDAYRDRVYHYIPECTEQLAVWYCQRLHIREDKRAFK